MQINNILNFAHKLHQIKIKLRPFESSEHINKKGHRPHRDFGYLNLFGKPYRFCNIVKANNSNLLDWLVFFILS